MIDIVKQQLELIKKNIKFVPNYPKQGILFRDITPLLNNPLAYSASITLLEHYYKNYKLTKIVGIEARGFLFGAPLALILKLSFVPARKSGKLPRTTISEPYILEYDSGCLEIHADAIVPGDKVLVIDDLLATGGTITAVVKLIRHLGGEVNHAGFLIALDNLRGKSLLEKIGINTYNLINFSNG